MYKDIVSINLLFLKNKANKNLKVILKQWIQENILILATCGLDNLKSLSLWVWIRGFFEG